MQLKGLLQVSDFDLRLLRVFRTVAQVGSFSAAEGCAGDYALGHQPAYERFGKAPGRNPLVPAR
jgi:uncharacterized protein (DUF924 family)